MKQKYAVVLQKFIRDISNNLLHMIVRIIFSDTISDRKYFIYVFKYNEK